MSDENTNKKYTQTQHSLNWRTPKTKRKISKAIRKKERKKKDYQKMKSKKKNEEQLD